VQVQKVSTEPGGETGDVVPGGETGDVVPGGETGDVVPGGEAVFAEVEGQELAVRRLVAALGSPVPSYLFVGPTGGGKRVAARLFAGELFAMSADSAADGERHRRLARAEQHPDLVVVERAGPAITADQARHVVRSASLSPVDARVKVILLVDFHLVGDQAAVVLKAIEEPPPTTMFIVLATDISPELVTIASRCVRIDFGPVAEAAVVARLVSEGVAQDQAEMAARAAGGDLSRARLLATDSLVGERLEAWCAVPHRLDGSGHAVATVVAELLAMVESAAEPLTTRHAAELTELEERVERLGERGSGRRDVDARHKRELRRHRTDELLFGFRAMSGVYRSSLVPDGSVSSGDVPATPIGSDDLVRAADLLRRAGEALKRNPIERLLLQSTFLKLPSLAE